MRRFNDSLNPIVFIWMVAIMTEHAKLPPSSAARRMQCPGSRAMEEMYPPHDDSLHAAEGELAHKVSLAAVKQTSPPEGATEEMLEGAELYRSVLMGFSPVGWHLEEKVPGLHPDNWGTPDAYKYAVSKKTLHVIDYKFGHRYVDVFENWQLLNYAGGIVNTLQIPDDAIIHLTIVQPRCYCAEGQVRHWSIEVGKARSYFDKITKNCEDSLVMLPRKNLGSECRDCSARRTCPSLQISAFSELDCITERLPFDLPDDQIGRELEWLKRAHELISARMSGIEQEVTHRIASGKAIKGWMIERGEGRIKWNKDTEEIIALGQMMGVDVSKPGLITPTQAIKKGLDKELVSQYSERSLGEPKLVPFKEIKLFKE